MARRTPQIVAFGGGGFSMEAGNPLGHVSLFRRDRCGQAVEGDIAGHLLAQDLVYVGGGNVVSMLGAWRAHGLDAVLRRAWRRGVVMCGPSAGSLCWFAVAQRVDAVEGELVRARIEPELLGGDPAGMPPAGAAVEELRAVQRLRRIGVGRVSPARPPRKERRLR